MQKTKPQKTKLHKADKQKPLRYTLNELLARRNSKAQRSQQESEWLASKPVGRELI
jgi:hypothetical protein